MISSIQLQGIFIMLYIMVRDYVNELLDHWVLVNKWSLHGIRRAKHLKLSIKKDADDEEEKETAAKLKNSQIIAPSLKEGIVWNTVMAFIKRGTISPEDDNAWIRRNPSTSLRGMLITYLGPDLANENLDTLHPQKIQTMVKAYMQNQDTDLLQRKIELSHILNKYITKRSHEWSKMHGVARANALFEIINHCKTQQELDTALVEFLHSGEVAVCDQGNWNFHKPSGTDRLSLRGELASFLLLNDEERKEQLLDSPMIFAAKPNAQVTPVTRVSETKENRENQEEAKADKRNAKLRDIFLANLGTMPAHQIAVKLKLNHYVSTNEEAEETKIDLDLADNKIDLHNLLDSYIKKHSPSWSKMHGVTRARELMAIVYRCDTQQQLNTALIEFLLTGEIAACDHRFWSYHHKASGTSPQSLRGEIASFLLLDKEQRRTYLETEDGTEEATEEKQDTSVRDNFLRELPKMTEDAIAGRLNLKPYNAAQLQMETTSCLPYYGRS
jgi:hypothetical protein